MKKLYHYFTIAMTALLIAGCSDDTHIDTPSDGGGNDNGNEEQPAPSTEGYADPAGVFIVNAGDRSLENGSLTYIAPDGTVTPDVYKQVNGSELGRYARAMAMYNGKYYILCDEEDPTNTGNGVLFICDAVTLKKEKAFRNQDFKFEPPATANEGYGVGFNNPSNIAVLDEHNIYIIDTQGLFRFDSTNGEMVLLEESYALGNQGRTIETCTNNKNLPILDGKLYVATGGFWKSNGVMEYRKGENKPSRTMEISTKCSDTSGLIVDQYNQMWLTLYNRENTSKSALYRIHTEGEELINDTHLIIKGYIHPGFDNTPGIALANQKGYFCGRSTTVSRCDLEINKTIEYIRIADTEPKAKVLCCNPTINPENDLLYIATCEDNTEGVESEQNLFIYDCSGKEAKLLQNIANQTKQPSRIYCVSEFKR